MRERFLNQFVVGYIECGLWACCDEHGESLDGLYTANDVTEQTVKQVREECRQFIEANARWLEGEDPARAGHDFYLTRNRHGAGFWDGDYQPEQGKALTEAAHVWGEAYFIANDNGEVELM